VAATALAVVLAGCGETEEPGRAPHNAAATAGAPATGIASVNSPGGAATPAAGTGSQRGASLSVQDVDQQLADVLQKHGFTGTVGQSLEQRLGRPVDRKLADVGRQLFFDRIVGLHNDNACAGCHSPANGFGDSQPISIGIQSNLLVGPDRAGPRNQRRAPLVMNAAFYPGLSWTERIASASGDPFDAHSGFSFNGPEQNKFATPDPRIYHLLVAHAHRPETVPNEMAGFTGVRNGVDPRLWVFDDGLGTPVPDVDASGNRNERIRTVIVDRLNADPGYRHGFSGVFPEVKAGSPIDMTMFARAIAEFEFTLVRANAPIDRFARGDRDALSAGAKRGGLLFFGKANCVACHAVGGQSNEMFSDFKMHNIGVPQIAPAFGLGKSNTIFDGPGEDEDYGLAQATKLVEDRYKFRTAPLRNIALAAAYFHNGAYARLDDAIVHHLDVLSALRKYNPAAAGVPADLRGRMAPIQYVSANLDPLVSTPISLSSQEVSDLVEFVRDGLLDPDARPEKLCPMVQSTVSKDKALKFENCK
jgi:cytochrome c peroxidase